MFALAGAGAAAVAAAGGSLAFWKAKREVNAMFEGDEKADQRRAEVEEAAEKREVKLDRKHEAQHADRANRRADVRHKYGLDAKEADVYDAPLSVHYTGLFSKGFEERHGAIVAHQLCIYKHQGDTTPIDRIKLAHARFEYDQSDKTHCTFVLHTEDRKQHVFQTADKRAAMDWRNALSKAIDIASSRH